MHLNFTPSEGNSQVSKDDTNPYEIRVRKREGKFVPPLHERAKFVKAGNFITMRYMSNRVLGHVKRVSLTHYKNIKTGEVKEYMTTSENKRRLNKRANLNRTFDDLRALIRMNFAAESENQLFITLTYARNMQSATTLQQDFEKFMKRLIYRYRGKYEFEYIAVMEPQGRGAWHVHLMIKSTNTKILFLPKEDVSAIWGHGYTTTARLKSDDVGNYYTAYFTGLIEGAELSSEESEFLEIDETSEDILKTEEQLAGLPGAVMTKMHVKGARLSYYPKHFKFYRCSRGIQKPERYDDYVYDIEQSNEYTKTQAHTYDIEKVFTRTCEDGELGEVTRLNVIHKSTYRKNDTDSAECESAALDSDNEPNIVLQSKYEILEHLKLEGVI